MDLLAISHHRITRQGIIMFPTRELTNATNLVRDTNALINNATVIPATTTDAQRSTLINFALGGDTGTAACSDASGAATACTTWLFAGSNPTCL